MPARPERRVAELFELTDEACVLLLELFSPSLLFVPLEALDEELGCQTLERLEVRDRLRHRMKRHRPIPESTADQGAFDPVEGLRDARDHDLVALRVVLPPADVTAGEVHSRQD
jgi:hypothetical protein